MKRLCCFLVALSSVFLFTGARRRAVRSAPPPVSLNMQRSFAVTDKAILDSFRLERVLDALAARSGVPGMTAERLFRQWFDTQNPKPGLDASMPHCNDEMTNGKPSLNGFQLGCPADAGFLATAPFLPDEFFPIAITNRFDQASAGNCGQYRIAYALKRGAPQESLHVIFEAALPNPDPTGDLLACRPVAEFWADLSAVDSMDERRARLEHFFFDGLPGFAPVIHPDHYRVPPAGVRTLQITAPSNLVHFFQYRLVRDCTNGTACTKLYMKQDVLENTMFGGLFDARVTTATATGFRAEFLKHVKTLVIPNLHLYSLQIPNAFLAPDTQPTAEDEQPSFVEAFDAALGTTAGIAFRDAILAEARNAGNTTLTPTDILRRVQTQTCGGCHFGGIAVGDGINFPLAGVNSFRQVTETLVNGRYNLSPAMNVFLQHRMQILRDFLAYGTPPVHSN